MTTTATDYSGNNNDGTLVNGPQWVAADITSGIQGALSFDGTNNYVEATNSNSTSINGAGTVECWINTRKSDGVGVWGNYNGTSDHGNFLLISGGQLLVGGRNGTSNYNQLKSPITTNKWYFVSFVSDGFDWILYLDGTEVKRESYGKLYWDDPPTLLYIGFFNWGDSSFDGLISECRVWNTARTQQQIQNNKDARLTGNETGLIGYWKLNDGVSNDVTDTAATTAATSALLGANATATAVDTATVAAAQSAALTAVDTTAAVDAPSVEAAQASPLIATNFAKALEADLLASIESSQVASSELAASLVSGIITSASVQSLLAQLDVLNPALQLYGDISVEPILSAQWEIQPVLDGQITIH